MDIFMYSPKRSSSKKLKLFAVFYFEWETLNFACNASKIFRLESFLNILSHKVIYFEAWFSYANLLLLEA